MTTKQPEFDLKAWRAPFVDDSRRCNCYHDKIAELGYYKGREVERQAVLEEVGDGLYLDQEQIEAILNRLGGEKS